jgi:hypothetical protein
MCPNATYSTALSLIALMVECESEWMLMQIQPVVPTTAGGNDPEDCRNFSGQIPLV